MVANWGWAILLVTLIITVALLPLRVKQVKSSMKMMKAQPLVDAIKRRYKGIKFPDPRLNEQNKEIQDLYKREGINPIGGCIPVLFQLPLLYAFFKVLEITVELRHAHWLWIPDLSSPDPLHIVPIVLFLSMLWLQSMTPDAGRGCDAGAHDAVHDAAGLWLDGVEFRRRIERVLHGEQSDLDRTAIGDEPNVAGQGDARDPDAPGAQGEGHGGGQGAITQAALGSRRFVLTRLRVRN